MDTTDRPASSVRAVAHALRVVEVLATADGSLGVVEVAARLGLPASTVHRLLATLVAEGWVQRAERRRYIGGPALERLRATPRPRAPLIEAARPVLRWLAETSGEAAHLAILDGTDVVSLEHAEGRGRRRPTHAEGAHVPAHATAVGLALLAHHPLVAETILRGGLARWTQETAVDAATFRRRLGDARRRGYAVNLRGWIDDTAGVAAPVLDRDGVAVASVGLSGPASRVARRAEVLRLGSLVRAGAAEIGSRLASDERRASATPSR
jgi:IclR family transcriptional regulator, KDG regulon repressor